MLKEAGDCFAVKEGATLPIDTLLYVASLLDPMLSLDTTTSLGPADSCIQQCTGAVATFFYRSSLIDCGRGRCCMFCKG